MKINFAFIFLVFLILKVTGVVTWSWWIITAPLWIPFGIMIIWLLILGGIALISALFLDR